MLNLLLVDDEPITREGIIENIQCENVDIKILQAEDGQSALKLASDFNPDILLTDIRMPMMDGIELSFKIRELYPACRIIFMSGYSDKEYLKSAIKLQAIDYVEKPINLAELNNAVNKAVAEWYSDVNKKQSEQQLQNTLLNTLPLVKNELALELTKMHTDWSSVNDKIAFCGLEAIKNLEFISILIKFSPYETDEITPLMKQKLQLTVEKALAGSFLC